MKEFEEEIEKKTQEILKGLESFEEGLKCIIQAYQIICLRRAEKRWHNLPTNDENNLKIIFEKSFQRLQTHFSFLIKILGLNELFSQVHIIKHSLDTISKETIKKEMKKILKEATERFRSDGLLIPSCFFFDGERIVMLPIVFYPSLKDGIEIVKEIASSEVPHEFFIYAYSVSRNGETYIVVVSESKNYPTIACVEILDTNGNIRQEMWSENPEISYETFFFTDA